MLRGVASHLDPATQTHLRKQVDDLAEEFAGVVSRETVERVAEESVDSLGDVRFDDYIPVLAYRFARERLFATGQAEGSIVKTVPEVLFVCVENAGRSQMAAALLDHRAEGRVHVRSAGSEPADQINPNVVEAMKELGVDIAREFPKPLTDEVVRAADAVITMGCGDACPVYPGKLYRDWQVNDPKSKSLEEVRLIRDEIDHRVRGLLDELV
jgi:arsenate reductase (thioredoxin)